MATTATQWDEDFLKMRRRDADEMATSARSDDDWAQAMCQIGREVSDWQRGYTLCFSARCRRARRCMDLTTGCHDRLPRYLPDANKQDLIEEVYAEIQEERQQAAEEGWDYEPFAP